MQDERNKSWVRKVAATVLLFVLAISISVPLLFSNPKPAQAQFTDPVTSVQTTLVNVWDTLKTQFVSGAISSLVNGANYFLSKLAYTLAVSLTSDCPGQVVCWNSQAFSEGLEGAWQGAIGEVVETLSEEGGFSSLGLNLCNPDIDVSMNIQLGLLDEALPPEEPNCTWNSFRENWSSIGDQFTTEEVLGNFSDMFRPGQNELSIELGIIDFSTSNKLDKKMEEGLNRLSTAAMGGFSDVTDPVSGRIKAPGSTVAEEYKKMQKNKEDDGKETTETMSAAELTRGAFVGPLMNMIQTFVQTFLSRLWNNFTDGLISSEEAIQAQPDIILSAEGIFRPPGKKTAREALTRLLAPPQRDGGDVDVMAYFTICPNIARTAENCVMDEQFANAVRVGAATPFTVQAAIDEGYLHGDWPFISAADSRNQDPHCYTEGYCESNLKKMRAHRIIPIGWEIAAQQAIGSYANVRLQDVVDAFDDCTPEGKRDQFHPFCHLIDPNWVLLAPAEQCRVQAFGPELVSSEIPQRAETCVDYQSCLQQDDYGQCIGGWGYCTREKNVWRMNGDQCPAEFNTCRSLTPAGGGSPVNYLMNTVDFGVCNSDNIGCSQYTTVLNVVSCEIDEECNCEAGCEMTTSIDAGETEGIAGYFCSNPGGAAFSELSATWSCSVNTPCNNPEGCDIGCTIDNGGTSCNSLVGKEEIDYDDWLMSPARYFNDKVESCDARDNGCSTLIGLAGGNSLNLIENGSFENSEGSGGLPGWLRPIATDTADYLVTGTDNALQGLRAIEIGPGMSADEVMSEPVRMYPGKMYTVSAAFMDTDGDEAIIAQEVVTFFDSSGNPIDPNMAASAAYFSEYIANYDTSIGGVNPCEMADVTGDGVPELSLIFKVPFNQIRAACSFFVTNPDVAMAAVSVLGSAAGELVYVDTVQLEEGPLTKYHDGYSVTRTINAKVPPKYLGCTGEPGDPVECDSFAGVCRETEVGCELYTPTNGDPAVPGIVSSADRCPAECSGYDMFFQGGTSFELSYQERLDLGEVITDDPADYFIPTTAKQCSAVDVGCSAFTNLETEEVEYFSQLRVCQKPNDDTKTFYTWEGSDTTGYQLRAWQLQMTSDVVSGSSLEDGTPALPGDDDNLLTDICEDGRCDDAGFAPCVKLRADQTSCEDDPIDRNGFCSSNDIENGDFDCREFYDSDGSRHYRRLSHTIIATEDCNLYRISGSPSEGDCHKWNGRWDATRDECTYSAAPAWSYSCSADAAGCRSYRGNASSNVRTMFVSDFESNDLTWRHLAAALPATISPESLVVGGHSVVVDGAPNETWKYVDLGNNDDSLYTLSFWARGNSTLEIGVRPMDYDCRLEGGTGTCTDIYGESCEVGVEGVSCEATESGELDGTPRFSDRNAVTADIPALEVRSEWRRYELGPIRIRVTDAGSFALFFSGEADVDDVDRVAYIDNVILKRVQDNITVIRDSWNTPKSCDSTATGIHSPLEMLGCKEYRTSSNQLTYLKSFSSLCRESAVGCQPYSNTNNTKNTTKDITYNAVCNLGGVCGDGVAPTGPNCPCNFEYRDAASSVGGGSDTMTLESVCRVPIGQSQCRFVHDGMDVSNEAPACTENFQCESNICEDTADGIVGNNKCVQLLEYPICLDDDGDDDDDLCASGDCRDGQCVAVNYSYNDRFVIPADERLYLVVGSSDMCAASAVGCISMGVPDMQYERECRLDAECGAAVCTCKDTLTGEKCSVEMGKRSCFIGLDTPVAGKWRGATIRDNPDKYDDTLCSVDAVDCGEFSASDGTYYFKDPSNQTCEFRTNISYENRKVSGWFRKSASGSIFPCYDGFLKEGSVYGIYRNKDIQYDGWVGLCAAENDRCEEFVDTLDVSGNHPAGQPYYYIDNTKLDKKTCQGQASLEQGCVPMLQTSSTQRLFSAAASYIKSQDQASGNLVSAVNCDTTSPNNYCNKRCMQSIGFCSGGSKAGEACSVNADCPAIFGGGIPICSIENIWGLGCTEDSDCSSVLGETCEDAPAELRRNDSNVILSVRRDRDCAEWLECNASMPVYDEQQGRWIERCSSLATCTSQVQVGESFACSEFKGVPKEILTVDDYSNRDITWNGMDYSGYSLVGAYPVEHLLPYQVTQGQCLDRNGQELRDRNGSIVRCRAASQCATACTDGTAVGCSGAAAAAQCTGPLSGVCVSGANDSLSCSTDKQCVDGNGIGFCSRSSLDIYKFGVQRSLCRNTADPTACSVDADCGVGGDCAVICTQDSDCPADGYEQSCTGAGCTTAYGTCLQNVCVYDFHGGPLRDTDWSNAPSCRAYPETNSPFSYRVLEMSTDKQNPVFAEKNATPGYNQFGTPAQKKLAFKGANVCNEGNTCECSYTKVGYGNGSSVVRYYSADVTRKHRAAPDEGDAGTKQDFISGVAAGICQGGPYEGQSCVPGGPADQCGTAEAGGGTCQSLNSYGLAIGWVGFCTDQDSSTKLNADPETPGCNLWLPLDMLPGITDSYSTSLSAGFQTSQDQLLYCSEAVGHAGTMGVRADGDPDPVGGFCANSIIDGAFQVVGCSTDDDCRATDPTYNPQPCTLAQTALDYCLSDSRSLQYDDDLTDGYNGAEDMTIAGCDMADWVGSCNTYACLIQTCRENYSDQTACDALEDLHDGCDPGTTQVCYVTEGDDTPECSLDDADCEYSPDIVHTCDSVDDGYDYSPCDAYKKILQGNEGAANHTSCEHGGGVGNFTNELWFCASQSSDPDGDLTYNTDQTSFPIHQNDISEIIIDISRTDGDATEPMRITLNADNNWEFATHFGGDLPDYYVEKEGIQYLVNEHLFRPGCMEFFIDKSESWADYGDDGTGDDRVAPWGEKNCIAAKVQWDASGNYSGMRTVTFTDKRLPDGNRYGRALHVPVQAAYLRVREICSEVTIAHDIAMNPPSVPFTNRMFLMKGSSEIIGIPSIAGMEGTYTWPSYVPTIQEIGLDHTPFGAVTSSTPLNIYAVNLSHGIPVVGAQIGQEEGQLTAGSPYYSHADIIEDDGDTRSDVIYPEIDSTLGYAIAAGYPFYCSGTCRVPDDMQVSTHDATIGNNRISQLFALTYGRARLLNSLGAAHYTGAQAIQDQRVDMMTVDGEIVHEAPKVMPALVFAGLCKEDGTVCPEFVGDGMSVNGVQGDLCFGGGVENNVQISYYVKADSDHMPIRRQIVDFGDGGLPLRLEGSFKNHRGLDSSGDYICGSADNDFGLSGDACDPHYMQFNKTYVCSANTAASLRSCNDANPTYPCQRDGCCVYKPRVQVMDNWGVCNGTCTDNVDGEGNLCFNSASTGYLAETYDATDGENECTILNSGDRSYANDARQPYTSYGGEITICPNNCP